MPEEKSPVSQLLELAILELEGDRVKVIQKQEGYYSFEFRGVLVETQSNFDIDLCICLHPARIYGVWIARAEADGKLLDRLYRSAAQTHLREERRGKARAYEEMLKRVRSALAQP